MADGGGLENRYGAVTLIVGSNPTPSALTSTEAPVRPAAAPAVSGRPGQVWGHRGDRPSCSRLLDEPGDRLGRREVSVRQHVRVVVRHRPGRVA